MDTHSGEVTLSDWIGLPSEKGSAGKQTGGHKSCSLYKHWWKTGHGYPFNLNINRHVKSPPHATLKNGWKGL